MKPHYVLIDYENVPVKSLALLQDEVFRAYVFLGPNNKSLPTAFAVSAQQLGTRLAYVELDKSGKNALDFHITYYLGWLAAQDETAQFHIVSRDTGFDSLLAHARACGIAAARAASLEAMLGLAARDAEAAPAKPARSRKKPAADKTANLEEAPEPAAQSAERAPSTRAKATPRRKAKAAAEVAASVTAPEASAARAAAEPQNEVRKAAPAADSGADKHALSPKARALASCSVEELVQVVSDNLLKRQRSRPATVKTLLKTIQSVCGEGVEDGKVSAVYAALQHNGSVVAKGSRITYPQA